MLTPVEIARLEERRQALATVEITDVGEPVGGGWMTFGGKGSWANQACALGLEGPVSDRDLDRLVDFYVSRAVEPRIEVCAFADASLLRGLGQRGFVLREFENVLVLELVADEDLRGLHPHGWPEDLVIEQVDPDDDLQVEAHVRVSASGFVSGELNEAMLETGRRTVRHPSTQTFNVLRGAEIVAGGAMDTGSEIAVLFGTSVLPEHRRQGIQLALILDRLHRAREEGCRMATIHSAPGIPTERNAGRVGFSLCYSKAILVAPGEGLEPSP